MKSSAKIGGERPTILIVDDETVIRTAFQIYFETIGYRVFSAPGGDDALERFKEKPGGFDVVILDLVMPGRHGIDVLRRMKEIDSSVEVIIATGCGSMNTAIEAMRHGAFDYITKPVIDLDLDLLSVVRSALSHKRSREGLGATATLPEIENRARHSRSAESTEAALARFYVALESYTKDMLAGESQPRKSLSGLAAVLDHHLRVLAVFLMKREASDGQEPKLHCEEKFGPWCEVLAPERGALPQDSLHKAHSKPHVWHRLDLELAPATDGRPTSPSAIEAMCVPVGRKCPDRFLVIFRRAQGWHSAPSPEGALLSLVAELALGPG